MDFITGLDQAITLGLLEFKRYLEDAIHRRADVLEHFFWQSDASQWTVLNYLISRYEEPVESADLALNELLKMIEYVLQLAKHKEVSAALHQALNEGKTQLALYLLQSNLLSQQSINQRDEKGRTLLSLVITSQQDKLLAALLQQKPSVHMPTYMSDSNIAFQPIHQAIVLNYAHGIRLLIEHGASLNNRCGLGQDTPVLLAAHLCKIPALEALLDNPGEAINLAAERSIFLKGKRCQQNAIERLCDHVKAGNNKAEALRGVAILLCHGAEPPRSESLRQLLADNRTKLLQAIHVYLEDKPHLVDAFVQRCHLSESALHHIVYARHSWGSAVRHLFGTPHDAAFVIEGLVARKYASHSLDTPVNLPMTTAENCSPATDPLKLYALFVKRYKEAYDNQLVTNRWSKMRWMIAEGDCDWAKVQRYVNTNPSSRSAIVYKELFKPLPKIHEALPAGLEEHNTVNAVL